MVRQAGFVAWARPYALLLLASVVAGAAVTSAPYIWTDTIEFGERATVPESVAAALAAVRWGIAGHYYRPTVFLFNALNAWVFGNEPLAFRAVNYALHVLNVLLVFQLVRGPFGRPDHALSSAALFAVHPIVVTPIAWVADRTDLIATAGALCAVIFFARAIREGKGLVAGACSLASLAIGLGAKESAAVAVLILAALAAVHPKRDRWIWGLLSAHALAVCAWFAWRSGRMTAPALRGDAHDVVARLAVSMRVHADSLFQYLAPMRVAVCDATVVPPRQVGLVAALLLIVLLAGAWYLLKRRALTPASILAVAWLVAFLLPTSGIVALKHVRADRYLYPALPALSFLVVATVDHLSALRPIKRALLAGIYAYFALALLMRVPRFQSDTALWTYEVARNPSCLEGLAYLARAAYLQERPIEALAHVQAIRKASATQDLVAFVDYDGVHHYEALSLMALDDIAAAERVLRMARTKAAAGRIRAEASYNLALISLGRSETSRAIRLLTDALNDSPASGTLADALLLRSKAYFDTGQRAAALGDLRRYDELAPPPSSGARRAIHAQLTAALQSAR